MPQTPMDDVVSHWHKRIENFKTSSLEFYDAVEKALERQGLPELRTARVDWNEGGLLSPKREYLRVYGEHHCFDMCAAPFGNGYFFSSWVTVQKARFVLLYYVLFAAATFAVWMMSQMVFGQMWRGMTGVIGALLGPMLSLASGFLFLPVAILVVLWGVALLARAGTYGPERAMLTVPLVGWFYQRTFAPVSYYRLDTMYMFQSAVQSALQTVINDLLIAKGLRGLNQAEFKPVESLLVGKPEPQVEATLSSAAAH